MRGATATRLAISFNRYLFQDDQAFVWKVATTSADYDTLKMFLLKSVMHSLQQCHVQDARAVENISRHLAWTQLWEINQARTEDYNIPELDTDMTGKVLTSVVNDCVTAALYNKDCVLFARISDDKEILEAVYRMANAIFERNGDKYDLKHIVQQSVALLQSPTFVNFTCQKMFRNVPEHKMCEELTRAMFEVWRLEKRAPTPIAGLVTSLVDKIARYFLKTIVLQYL